MRRFYLLAYPALLVVLSAGCEINGNDSLYPGASVWQSSDKGFHFHYMQPPWYHKAAEKGWLVRMQVDGFMLYSAVSDSITYKLDVGYHKATSAELAAKTVKAERLKNKHRITTDLDEVVSHGGDEGWELYSTRPGFSANLYFRDTFFADDNGKIVHFAMLGAYALDEQDIHDMIRSYAAGPDDGSDVPERRPDSAVAKKDGGAQDGPIKKDGGKP